MIRMNFIHVSMDDPYQFSKINETIVILCQLYYTIQLLDISFSFGENDENFKQSSSYG